MADGQTGTNATSVMRRKAGAGRPLPEIGRVTPTRLLRTALARAGEDIAGLVVQVTEVGESRTSVGPFCANLPETPMIGLCEGPDGSFAAVVLDIQALSALIEMQTTGRVVPLPADVRVPTRTDALLAAGFIDRVLELFEGGADEAGLPLAETIAGYRFAMKLADARAVELALEDGAYRLFDVTADFGGGAKSGRVKILLPWAPRGGAGAGRGGANSGWASALEQAVSGAEVDLRAVLARRDMTLGEVTALAPGILLALPRSAIGAIGIEDIEGTRIAHGRLGQTRGQRAVRLTEGAGDGGPAEAGLLPGPASVMLETRADPVPVPDPDSGADLGLPDLSVPGPPGDGTMPGGLPDLALPGDDGILPELAGAADLAAFGGDDPG